MLTKRQKNERYLSMFTFFFGLLMLMTLFIPSAKGGNYTFMGLDIVFGEAFYNTNNPVIVMFSWYNFLVYFLPITGGILLVIFDRLLNHESKIKLVLSFLPMVLFLSSFLMFFFIPQFTNVLVGDEPLLEHIDFYVGPFFAIGFIIVGVFTSFMYFVQESKIHQLF